ncbi:MAG: hypothetical protein WAQ99_20190 [Pyrinomonadaceae bacterium]
MAEITKANEEQKEERKSLHILELVTMLFFLLNLASSLVIMLLPFKEKVLGGLFTGQPAPYRALWMLFTLSLVLMILLNALSPPKDRRRDNWKFFGTVNVIVGFLCAVEIFVLQAFGKTHHASLWWLLAILTVLGAIAVVLTEKLKSRELAEAKRKQDEEALTKKRKTIPTVVRLKVRRYYVSESKTVACDN